MDKRYQPAPHVQRIQYLNRPAFLLLLSTLLGLVLFLTETIFWGSIILFVLALIALFLRRRDFSLLLLWSIAFAWYAHLRDKPRSLLPAGKTLYDTPVIVQYPTASSLESALHYHAKVWDNGTWLTVQLHFPKGKELPEQYQYGSSTIATLDLTALREIKSDSYRRYLLSEGYDAQGNIHHLSNLQRQKHPSLASILQRVRASLVRNFDHLTAGKLSSEERGLIYALTLGDRSHLPSSVRHSFNTAGVAHILAVSGYHLGIVYGVLAFILSLLLYKHRQRRLRYLLLFLGLLIYTFISGGSTATVRAFLMSSLFLLGRFLGRPTDAIQVLSLTFLAFLFIEPYSIYSVGLLLSLSAVWGIYLFLPIFKYYFQPHYRVLRHLGDILFVSLSAQIGVFPLLLLFFGSASLSFLWSNIPLVLLSGLLIPYALVLILLGSLIGTLPSLLIKGLQILSHWMIEISNYFSQLTLDGLLLTERYDLILVALYYLIVQLTYNLLIRKINA